MPPEDVDFPPELPASDLVKWQKLTADQRISAANRIKAFADWHSGLMTLDKALDLTDLSKSRFYRLAADWRAMPTLDALGAAAGTAGGAKSTRLHPTTVNALQAVVSNVVRFNHGASISQLVRLMVEEAKVPADTLPSPVRLRQFVEDELRRLQATGEAGHAIRLDCTAIDIPREGGRPYVMFACLDAGTRLILGAAVGEEPVAASGYALAAGDALRRIERDFCELSWTKRLARIEITAGTDVDASVCLVKRVLDATSANVQLASSPKRFGKYLRTIVGPSVGRVLFTPARTESGLATPNNKKMTPWSQANAAGAVEVMVNEYNANILKDLIPQEGSHPPDALMAALGVMAQGT